VALIPAFELGVWNAWIFILPIIIIMIFGSKILGKRESEEDPGISKKGQILGIIDMVIRFVFYFYSIFLPLKLDAIWFVIGLLIYLPFMFFLIVALWNFATTPVDKLVTKGVYRISRNPMFVGLVLVDLSISIACLSWVFLLLAILDFLLLRHYVVLVEEPILIGKHGDSYREYMKKTPRWIGIPKSE